jgi:hypothetical protein
LITQEEDPPDILPTSKLTMAILPNVAKKKFKGPFTLEK